ncbi:MAG TPA: FHA domain-containing protein [Polyangiales bacterium]|nr:FHA domain-containing protein [Polyangiales bacterium]
MALGETPTRETVPRLPMQMQPEPARLVLILTTREEGPQLIEFGARQHLTVGRTEPSELCVRDVGVSRTHARFSRSASGVRVTDLESRNGVWLRGERVSDVLLEHGDCVVIGDTTIQIQAALSPADAAFGRASFVTETGLNLRASLQDHEAKLIRDALRVSGGNQRRAASLLELPLRTFERKLRNMTVRQRRAPTQTQ